MLDHWNTATIGVANLDLAMAFWIDAVGYSALAMAEGSDPGLAQQWSLPAAAFKRQALIGRPETLDGRLHLIEMQVPGPSVRSGAAVFDACIKNIDIYVCDIEARVFALRELGYSFRSAVHGEIVFDDGTRFLEMHLGIHDDVNLVLLELPDRPAPCNAQGFGAIGPIISVVPAVDAEKRFYRDGLGLAMLTDNFLDGEEIERMIGLPSGAGLDVSIWGQEGERNAQLELVEYTGVEGENRFALASLPNCGLHQVCFNTANAAEITAAARAAGARVVHRGPISTLAGTGDCWSIYTPAGMRIDLLAAQRV